MLNYEYEPDRIGFATYDKFDQESWNVASDQISMMETLSAIDELIRNEIAYVPEFEEHEFLTDLSLDLKMSIYNLNNDTIIVNVLKLDELWMILSNKIYLVKTKIEFILNDITKAQTPLKAV